MDIQDMLEHAERIDTDSLSDESVLTDSENSVCCDECSFKHNGCLTCPLD